jgi:hypothetical protein
MTTARMRLRDHLHQVTRLSAEDGRAHSPRRRDSLTGAGSLSKRLQKRLTVLLNLLGRKLELLLDLRELCGDELQELLHLLKLMLLEVLQLLQMLQLLRDDLQQLCDLLERLRLLLCVRRGEWRECEIWLSHWIANSERASDHEKPPSMVVHVFTRHLRVDRIPAGLMRVVRCAVSRGRGVFSLVRNP